MSEIKLFVTHTPNRNSMLVEHPLFYPVIAGADFQKQPVRDGVLLDNTGDNISSKNKSYCELTTQYWAWKNVQADYYGFCHYRRFFSFHEGTLPVDDWGVLSYPALTEQVWHELNFDETAMKKKIEQYDFLIAEGIPTKMLRAKSVYDHYRKAPELHEEDIEILLAILEEKYPDIADCAKEFFAGDIFYPCNMFIMKRELFCEYSSMLFDVLEEFEKRADMSHYSREGYRTTGHLGERMAGIFYCYLKKKGGYRLGELQIALLEHADAETKVEKKADVVPVVLAANEKYVPILYTCLKSIIDHASPQNQYEFYIFHTDITPDSQRQIQSDLQVDNRRITFVNVCSKVAGYRLQAKEHITTETFYRFLILDILEMYEKVVYLDCDMIIERDVAELYHTEMGNNLIAAVRDPDFVGQYNGADPETKKYCDTVLKLKDPYRYFQAGVLVLNVKELQKVTSVQKLFEMSDTGIYKYSDQDILNVICEDRVTYLDMSWNVLTDCNGYRWHSVIQRGPHDLLDAYEEARKHPYIIHYAGFQKPWMQPKEDMAKRFWTAARTTPYYEEILGQMDQYLCGSAEEKKKTIEKVKVVAKKVLPKGSWLRRTAGNLYWKLRN